MSFRRRDFPEVLDNLLTEVVGGVAAEPQPFPPTISVPGAPLEQALERPKAKRIVSAYGSRHGLSMRFREGVDYELRPDGQTLRWLKGASLPDEGSIVHVNYLREDVSPTLTDLQVGSVLRTLAESVSLEIARLYAQLDAVYDAGFIDTATGSALDKCVALLGVARIRGNRAATAVRFTRAPGTPGSITISAGTRIIDARARFEYATTDTITMAPNQNSVTVAANDLEPANEPVEADVLSILPVPIAGISGVTNPGPASRASADETDIELRTRAKSFLHGSERATLGALQQVLARQQIRADLVEVPETPGLVRVTPQALDLPPERVAQLIADLDAARPAGVRIELLGVRVPASVDVDLKLVTLARLPQTEVERAHSAVRAALGAYFDALPLHADASLNQIVGRVLAVQGVEDVQLSSARVRKVEAGVETTEERLDAGAGVIHLAEDSTVLGALRVTDPNLPTAVSVVVRFPGSGPLPDPAKLEAALAAAIAFFNDAAAGAAPGDAAATARRSLSLGKLLRVLPLPGRTAETLAGVGPATPLPGLSDVAPFGVSAFVQQSDGLTQALLDPASSYVMAPDEHLGLRAVTLVAE
jgi:uncharacterized phage protein gp47/JayE